MKKTFVILNEMLCDAQNDLHLMRKPQVLETIDDAISEAMKRLSDDYSNDYSKKKGFKVNEVKGRDDGDAHYITAYFNDGFVEYRIDEMEIPA